MTDSPPPTESVEAAEAVSTAQEISAAAQSQDQFLVTTDSSTPMASAQAKSVPSRSIEATAKEVEVDKEAARGKDTGEAASFARADRSEPDSMAATETESEASEATMDSQSKAIVLPTFAPPDGVSEQQAKVAATPEALSSALEENDVSGELPVEATTTAETAGVENPGRVDEMTEDDTPEAVPESEDAAVGDHWPTLAGRYPSAGGCRQSNQPRSIAVARSGRSDCRFSPGIHGNLDLEAPAGPSLTVAKVCQIAGALSYVHCVKIAGNPVSE